MGQRRESPPAPAGGSDEPAALWSAVASRLSDRPSTAWLRYLQLARIDGDTAWVSILPGHGEVRAIATPARLEPVAAALSELRGCRTRLELVKAADRAAGQAAGDAGLSQGAGGGASGVAPGGAAGSRAIDRRAAVQLPLVRQAMEFFPDATVIDVREERADPPKEDVGPSADNDDPGADEHEE